MTTEVPIKVRGREPTREENFYREWAMETLKGNIALASASLRELVALNTAMLGGSIVFLDKQPGPGVAIMVVCFLVSLTVALVGSLPYATWANLNSPSMIRDQKFLALTHKVRFLWVSAGFLLSGFAAGVIGMAIRAADPR